MINNPEQAATRSPVHHGGLEAAVSGQAFSLAMLTRYNAWCNQRMFDAFEALPAGEAMKERPTRFKNMVHTMNHIYVIDRIFKAHLEGRPHGFAARNTDTCPPLAELRAMKTDIDQWYTEQVDAWSAQQLAEPVAFEYVGGGKGMMTRNEIVLHIVNHGTYHRGVIADMLYQVPVVPPVSDITVYVRDVAMA